MNASSTGERVSLDRVRERRNALRVTLQTLEDANAAPAGTRWRERMAAALDHAAVMLAAHITETEGPEGFFEELVRHEPRVHQHVDVLREEHVELQRELARLIERCTTSSCGAAEMRDDVTELMAVLHHHRQAGADLLYEAYEVDVASGD